MYRFGWICCRCRCHACRLPTRPLDVVQCLLAHHAAVDRAAQEGVTPLSRAAEKGHLDVVSCLLAHHAAMDCANQRGLTPLSKAAQQGHLDVVRCLLAHYAAVDGADQEGVTPLYIAARNGHLDVVRCLLAQHAAGHARNGTYTYGTKPHARSLFDVDIPPDTSRRPPRPATRRT